MVTEYREDVLGINTQDLVAGGMAVLVVDALEMIEIHESKGQRETVTLHPRHFVLQPPHESAAIRETGQLISQAEHPHPAQLIGQFAAVRFDQLQIMVRTVELVGKLIVPFHELVDLADQRPARILDTGNIFGLAQLGLYHLENHAEFLILGNRLHHLLPQAGLQLPDILTPGV